MMKLTINTLTRFRCTWIVSRTSRLHGVFESFKMYHVTSHEIRPWLFPPLEISPSCCHCFCVRGWKSAYVMSYAQAHLRSLGNNKAAFINKKTLVTSRLDLNLRKKRIQMLHWKHSCVATLDRRLNILGEFRNVVLEKMEKIIGTDLVKNEEVLLKAKKERNFLHTIKRREG